MNDPMSSTTDQLSSILSESTKLGLEKGSEFFKELTVAWKRLYDECILFCSAAELDQKACVGF